MYPHKLSGFVFRITLLYLTGIASLYGHAILLDAAPTANQVIDGSHTRIRLRFNSRIDAKRSRITLVASDGRRFSLNIDKQASDDALSSEVKDLQHGTYLLRWQVLAYDGHITRGEIRFQVR
jgi:methionine-rich copper-binding protein CopC